MQNNKSNIKAICILLKTAIEKVPFVIIPIILNKIGIRLLIVIIPDNNPIAFKAESGILFNKSFTHFILMSPQAWSAYTSITVPPPVVKV